LQCDSEKLDPQTIHTWNFRRPPCPGWICGII